ncbi:MAG TPA: cobalt ECF transporter T component CbiQ [Rhodospirillaceae bacterium]|nr:cobalt ECF transporter T component CbiQ [Rhodospirillaceae bacterium]
MSAIDRTAHLNPWRHRSLTEKAVLALGMLLLAMIFPPFPTGALIAGIMASVTLLGARVPVRTWIACVLAPAGFLFLGALTLLVQFDGDRLSWAAGGGAAAAALIVRSLAGLFCLLFLALTTPASDLLAGLRRFGLPSEIAEVALLIYRMLFLFGDTAKTMDAAQAARLGHRGVRRRLHALGMLLASLLPRVMDRARRMEMGLAARAWDGEMRVLGRRPVLSMPALILILSLEAGTALLGVLAS